MTPYSDSRRTFLSRLATTAAVAASTDLWAAALAPEPLRIQVFTKHLDGFSYDELAGLSAEAGFDGLDMTVRPAGHVLPERVADDLPRAVEAAQKAGLGLPTIVTALTSASSPQAEAIVKTAAAQGVRAYRTGWIDYLPNETMEAGVERIRKDLIGLARLNQKYGIHGGYQNHSGQKFGAPVWDLADALRGQDARYLGCQYDLYHATVEGSNSWPLGFRRIHPFVRTIDVKDFRWMGSGQKLKNQSVPLGEGQTDFPAFFRLMKQVGLRPLLSIHFEYPMPTAKDGAEGRKQLVAGMKRDLTVLKNWLSEAGL